MRDEFAHAPVDLRKIKRLLIVKLSAIGDVVHALPVSQALGESFPNLEISWVVEQVAAPLLEGNPYLKEVIILPPEWKTGGVTIARAKSIYGIQRDLKRRGFEVTVDLQGLSKSALIAKFTGARHRFGYDWLRELAPMLETRIPRRPASIHIVDQFLDAARYLGARVDRVQFPLVLTQTEMTSARKLLAERGIDPNSPMLVINPTAGAGGNKGWGAALFGEVAARLHREHGIRTVVVGAKSDWAESQIVCDIAGSSCVSVVGGTNLRLLASILKTAAVHLCGDTGSAHIAAALGTPTVSIFGRSNPLRLAPYGHLNRVLHHREGCTKICAQYHERAPVNSAQKCLNPPPKCLSLVTVDEVMKAVLEAMPQF